MKTFDQALTDGEIDALNEQLSTVKGGKIPNVEALDGFFAALACCPDFVLPSEYMEVIQRGESDDGDLVLEDMDEVRTFFGCIARHWNHVMWQLREGPVYLPLLLEDAAGQAHGNDWANGFLTGTKMRHAIWAELFQDEDHSGPMVPIWVLAYEHHPEPGMRPYEHGLTVAQREEMLIAVAAGTMRLYRHFLPLKTKYPAGGKTALRVITKQGRNEPCACGSGKKYKLCCGRTAPLH